jgi:hypothetical protein
VRDDPGRIPITGSDNVLVTFFALDLLLALDQKVRQLLQRVCPVDE